MNKRTIDTVAYFELPYGMHFEESEGDSRIAKAIDFWIQNDLQRFRRRNYLAKKNEEDESVA